MKTYNYEEFVAENPKIQCVRMVWDMATRRYRYETEIISEMFRSPRQIPIKQLKDGDIAILGKNHDDGPARFLVIKQGDTLYCSEQQETWKTDEWRLLYEFLNNGVHPKRAIEMVEL